MGSSSLSVITNGNIRRKRMPNQKLSAKAEKEIENFCSYAVKIEKSFKTKDEARKWYIEQFRQKGKLCNLYGCPIKMAMDLYGEVNSKTISKTLKKFPYKEENASIGCALGFSEEYLLLSSNCSTLQWEELNKDEVDAFDLLKFAAICQTLGFNKRVILDILYSREQYILAEEFLDIAWNNAKSLMNNNVSELCLACCGAKKVVKI